MHPCRCSAGSQATDAHYSTFLAEVRGSDGGTSVNFPWVLPRATVGIDRFPRQVPQLMATSTANATVLATARAADLSVAHSVVPTMATNGFPRQFPRQFPRKLPWLFPWPSATIATATLQSPRTSAEARGNCHGSFCGRPTAAISTAIRGRPRPLPRYFSDSDTKYLKFPTILPQ